MKTKSIFLAMLTAGLLTACSNETDLPGMGGGNTLASFSGNIAGQPATRAYDTSWETGDAIGISGTSGGVQYTNVSYTTDGDGNFAVTTAGEEIYFQNNEQVAFTAYYPWNDLQGATAITADTKAQAAQKTFDFLWATATGSKASPNVQFAFSHKMAKLVLTIKCGADVSLDEVKGAIIGLAGHKDMGEFNVTDGTATATSTAYFFMQFLNQNSEESYNAPVTVDETNSTVSYNLIVFPQAFETPLSFYADILAQQMKAELDFTEGNTAAGDTDPKNEWVAGRQYNMSVTLHKTAITVEGCTIEPWEEVNAGNVDAE